MTLGDFFDLIRVYRGQAPLSSASLKESPGTGVIMGAQVLPGGRPSPALEARTRHGAALYKKGVVNLLVPTGGLGEYPPTEAGLMLGILSGEGVPDKAVLLEEKALNTWDSAVLVTEICRDQEIGAVRIITDPLHCVRTVWAFRKLGLVAIAEPAYNSPMWRKPWSRGSQLFREFGALAWYKIRHGAGLRSRL